MGYVLWVAGGCMVLAAFFSPEAISMSPLWAVAGAILIHAGEASLNYREKMRKVKHLDYDD